MPVSSRNEFATIKAYLNAAHRKHGIMSINLLSGLNEQQYNAVTAGEGPVLVLAGPGSGKTGVLTRRVAYLIREMAVQPWQIMAVTFTNKAAKEMRERINNFLDEKVRNLQIGTFHATCARILRLEHHYTDYGEDYVIYDTDDQLTAIQQAMGELNISTKKFSPRRVLNAISNAKNEVILPTEFVAQDYFTEIVARVYPRYQSILVDSNAMDFDDLLMQMVLALKQHQDLREKYQARFPFVLVDEFQDTNMVQYQLVQLMGKPQNNIFVVGDEDQSIYAFRGADYRNVLRFHEDYPDAKVILLEQNYRSTQVVLDVARAVIDKNHNRTSKALFTDRAGGDLVMVYEAYNDDDEARYIMDAIEDLTHHEGYAYNDVAIMYRTNAQSRALEEAAIRMGVPHSIVGSFGFYQRREVRDLFAYLRVIHNPKDRVSFARIINTPKRGIGKKSLQDFQYWAAQNKLTYGEALQKLMDGEANTLSSRAAKLFAKFGEQVQVWQAKTKTGNLSALFDSIIADTAYTMYLHDISDSTEQANDRSENLRELRGLLARADDEEQALGDFLADQMLMTDADTMDASGDRVTLLTLHAAKGLEFPVVFITGLEAGLLPHIRAYDEPDGMQEERRLFYVGITRAKDRLYITYAFRRALYGGFDEMQEQSEFLTDIPEESVDPASNRSFESGQRSYKKMTTWDQDTSGLHRLSQDLHKQKTSQQHVSDEELRDKIIPFPGGKVARNPLKYKTGMSVHHPAFGKGTVIESRRVDQTEQVTVAFANRKFGLKTLDAEFAQMRILD